MMHIFSSFFGALIGIVNILLSAYFLIVLVAALLSWIKPDPYHPIVRFIRAVTEPVFYRIRRLMPFVMVGGFDLSPVVVLLAIEFLKMFLGYMFVGVVTGGFMP